MPELAIYTRKLSAQLSIHQNVLHPMCTTLNTSECIGSYSYNIMENKISQNP